MCLGVDEIIDFGVVDDREGMVKCLLRRKGRKGIQKDSWPSYTHR